MKTIAESNNFIVLDNYEKQKITSFNYQRECDLEKELVYDLIKQGYCPLSIKSHEDLLLNLRTQIESLNKIKFTDKEWERLLIEYINTPNDTIRDKSKKIHHNYIYDFKLDTGELKNIYLIDKNILSNNKLQVMSQYTNVGKYLNRYDVAILLNGLPIAQIELKKRGNSIIQAFNQIHRYTKESFNRDNSLFKYLQIFVISNGTDTKYFANTLERSKQGYDFTINWASFDNKHINDLKDFTLTFFEKRTFLELILRYCVLDVNDNLLVMRPYQIAATERALWKVKITQENNLWNKPEAGGYIWHTTGSGKTLTSFKLARMISKLDYIHKVLFVVDRKDLDYQTMLEYRRFSPDSVNGSTNTRALKRNLESNDNKIVVTTIQKLNSLLKSESKLDVYSKPIVFIFDEAHRSQFGETQNNIRKSFKKYIQFGFTGTPIFDINSINGQTTESVFGKKLHAYTITNALEDDKCLKYKIDYMNVEPMFREHENEDDIEKITKNENKFIFQHPTRIEKISKHLLETYRIKTQKNKSSISEFNVLFAVSTIEAAKLYYEKIEELQKDEENKLKVATIFSINPNDSQSALGEIKDEDFEISAMNSSSKEFLEKAINKYNIEFKSNYNPNTTEDFQNYYKSVSEKFKKGEIDLLIVVGMFLTGFDSYRLNTIYIDKNLKYHGLIQTISRVNRIYPNKKFGNVITYRNLEKSVEEALKLYGDINTSNIILERPYKDYMIGFDDMIKGKQRGFEEIVKDLKSKFPDPSEIRTEREKAEFVNIFGEYLRIENKLRNYDEFTMLNIIATKNEDKIEEAKTLYQISDELINDLKQIDTINIRLYQDYCSVYYDIKEWVKEEKQSEESTIDWKNIDFEVDLLKNQDVNLDYLIELIYKNKNIDINELKKQISESLIADNKIKTNLINNFIDSIDVSKITDKAELLNLYIKFEKCELDKRLKQLIEEEDLDSDKTIRFIDECLKYGEVITSGTDLKDTLKIKNMLIDYTSKKERVFDKYKQIVKEFKYFDK